jgi:hypothetical protein
MSWVTSKLLQTDGCNKKLKIAFAYQGEQHEKLSYFNDFNEKKLFQEQERDRHKASECARRAEHWNRENK